MGTRSLTFVKEDGKVIMCMYRQMDGYPSGHGKDLAEFLKDITMVNGIGMGQTKIANGAGCLAAQIVAHFKDGPGGIYLQAGDTVDSGQDYDYVIDVGFDRPDIKVTCKSGENTMFYGEVKDFAAFCESDD